MTIGTGTALQYLTNRFAGQLVLYSAELAEVLGKSERALGHLIARGSLPFKTKKLGGRICVDVFQVAERPSSHEELSPMNRRRMLQSRAVEQQPCWNTRVRDVEVSPINYSR